MKILLNTLVLSVLFLFLHLEASSNAWYFYFWWFDILMHFLGGVILGFLLFWIMTRIGYVGSDRSLFLKVTAVVLIIAVSWEVFEYMHDIYGKGNYILDTTGDIITAIIGMYIAGKIVLKVNCSLAPSTEVLKKPQVK